MFLVLTEWSTPDHDEVASRWYQRDDNSSSDFTVGPLPRFPRKPPDSSFEFTSIHPSSSHPLYPQPFLINYPFVSNTRTYINTYMSIGFKAINVSSNAVMSYKEEELSDIDKMLLGEVKIPTGNGGTTTINKGGPYDPEYYSFNGTMGTLTMVDKKGDPIKVEKVEKAEKNKASHQALPSVSLLLVLLPPFICSPSAACSYYLTDDAPV